MAIVVSDSVIILFKEIQNHLTLMRQDQGIMDNSLAVLIFILHSTKSQGVHGYVYNSNIRLLLCLKLNKNVKKKQDRSPAIVVHVPTSEY